MGLRSRFWVAAALLLTACAGNRNAEEGARLEPGKEELIDALTLFVEAVQGDRFDKAMAYLTPSEKMKMTEGAGVVSPPVQRQLKALRLSTLANKPGVHLEKGKIEGIYAWLPNLGRTGDNTTRGEPPPPLP